MKTPVKPVVALLVCVPLLAPAPAFARVFHGGVVDVPETPSKDWRWPNRGELCLATAAVSAFATVFSGLSAGLLGIAVTDRMCDPEA